MQLWVPEAVNISQLERDLQTWLDTTCNHAYQNIIQDRVNSLFPMMTEHKNLYKVNVSVERVIQFHHLHVNKTRESILCPICHEEDTLVNYTLPCKHIYHSHCIKKWLQNHNTCPLCRCKV